MGNASSSFTGATDFLSGAGKAFNDAWKAATNKRSDGTFLGGIRAGVVRGLNDGGVGVGEVLKGNVGQGVEGAYKGYLGAVSGGLTEKMGMKGQTSQAFDQIDAANIAKDDAANATQAMKNDRLNRVSEQINQMAKYRLQVPGRAQSLLGGASSGASAKSTILTSGGK